MRRFLFFLVLAVTAFAWTPAASAQDDGCEQANPCIWFVVVGPEGFYESGWTWTTSDWIRLVVSNDDGDIAHTVGVDGTSIRVTAPPDGEAQSDPFQLAPGRHDLRDEPTGDTAAAEAVEGDAVAHEAGATGTGSSGRGRIPGFGLLFAVLALAGLAFFVRAGRRLR